MDTCCSSIGRSSHWQGVLFALVVSTLCCFTAGSLRAANWNWTGDAWLANGTNNWYGAAFDPWTGNVINNWGVVGGTWFPAATDNVVIGQHFDVGIYNNITVGSLSVGTGTTIEIYNNDAFTVTGGIINNGLITVNYDVGYPSVLTFSGTQTLSGAGTIALTDNGNNTGYAQLNT